MTRHHDVVVLGAGPAGTAAALEASRHGLRTLLLDEGQDAGGQVYRPPCRALKNRPRTPELDAGDALRRELSQSRVETRFGQRVWLVERGFRLASLGPEGPEQHSAESLIVATGAQERYLPVPGWTLPGVIGLAAATILLKAQGLLPGHRTVVAGSGPLLFLVAATIVKSGGEVPAVICLNRRIDWWVAMRAMVGSFSLLSQGAGWLALLRKHRVPILWGHAVKRIEGSEGVSTVVVTPLAGGSETRLACDALCLGFGLTPSTEVTRLLGAEHTFDPQRAGTAVATDANQATSIPRLYACGDGSGVLGAAAAPLTGRLAGLSAAHDAGMIVDRDAPAVSIRRRLVSVSRLGRALMALMTPPAAVLDLMTPDTIVCRCETVTAADLEAAIASGSRTMNDLKSATRCGMGPCGGRVCGEFASMLIAARTGKPRAAIDLPTARPPIRPVSLGAIGGRFEYEDLPNLQPAPL